MKTKAGNRRWLSWMVWLGGLLLVGSIGACAETSGHATSPIVTTNALVVPAQNEIQPTQDVFTFLDQRAPEVAQDLRQWKTEGYREDYAAAIRSWSQTIAQYNDALRESPANAEMILKLARLDHECDQLAEKIKEIKNPIEKTKNVQALHEKLGIIFDYQIQKKETALAEQKQDLSDLRKDRAAAKPRRKERLENEISDLQEEITTTTQMLQKRRANKTAIITKHLNDLLEDEALQWWE